MTNRSRARWSLAAAFAAHALAMAWTLGRRPPPSGTQGAHGPPIEIEIADEPAPPVPPPAPVEEHNAEPVPQAVATHVASRATQASSPTSAVLEAQAAPAGSAVSAGDGSWSFSPVKPSAQTGVGEGTGSAAALDKATVAGIGAVLAEAERKAEDRKRKPQIFTSRDMDMGMVPGGQYVSMTRDRVRNSLIPLESHALVEFWTDSHGLVARVRVLDATSDRRAWDDVAEALVEDAHATFPLKVPSNADGLIVTLDVTSVMKTLSGAMASRNALVKAIGAIQDPVDAVLDSKAVPQRVVSARIVGVEAF